MEEKRREDLMRDVGIRVVRVVNEDLGSPWAQKAARIRDLLAAPFVGPRSFRTVLTAEPVRPSEAA